MRPVTPDQCAGPRMDPPVSLPSAPGARPPASAAAAPMLEPPVKRVGSQGFRDGP